MVTKDPRVDEAILSAAPFARPILEQIRKVVHSACPEAVETLKWRMPHFMYRGAILCGMAAFKKHVAFGFWQGRLVVDDPKAGSAMGQYGCLTKVSDLPSARVLAAQVKKAMALREAGVKAPRDKMKKAPVPLKTPKDLHAALAKNKKARATYDAFAPSHKREYHEWLMEAKREATRKQRLAQAVAWMGEGKPRNWKYQQRTVR